MWSEQQRRVARRVIFLAPLLLALPGCGFHPLYAAGTARGWDPDLAAINVARIPDRPGQILALALRESLNPGGETVPARWTLNTTLVVTRVDLGIQTNATATTSEITANANYNLVDTKTGKSVFSGSSRAVGDFNLLLDAYATEVASESARDRALRQLADDMTLRLALFMRSQRETTASR